MKYYIAYGSNLSVRQMAVRCPEARVAGKAVLKDWKLVIKLHATIEPAKRFYFKRDLEVTLTDLKGKRPRQVTAMVYIMTEGRAVRMPMKGYVDVLVEGYERFGFDLGILRRALRDTSDAVESEADRYDFS